MSLEIGYAVILFDQFYNVVAIQAIFYVRLDYLGLIRKKITRVVNI